MLDIIREARVSTHIVTNGDKIQLKIIVNEKYEHVFDAKSNESRMVFTTDKGTLDAIFDKGTYVFYNGILVDYRNADSRSFIHSDKAIDELSSRIGIEHYEKKAYSDPVNGLFNQSRGRKNNGVFLGGEYNEAFELDIPELGYGGRFKNSLIYKWSPFSNTITTSLEVQRLVCTNGMVANAPFVTFEVPVINDWEKSLEVIYTRLETKINEVLSHRFKNMAHENSRSSVADLARAYDLLNARINNNELGQEQRARMNSLIDLVNPSLHLSNVYSENVLNDNKLARTADGHITQYDLFNILTEASTHYGRDEDNDVMIQNHLNKVVFDDFKRGKKLAAKVPELGDSDHRRAFFGKKGNN